jgi:hypothetical protein
MRLLKVEKVEVQGFSGGILMFWRDDLIEGLIYSPLIPKPLRFGLDADLRSTGCEQPFIFILEFYNNPRQKIQRRDESHSTNEG